MDHADTVLEKRTMKKTTVIIFLVIEFIIFLLDVSVYAQRKGMNWQAEIDIPGDLMLTIVEDVTIPEISSIGNPATSTDEITIIKGTVIRPLYIGYNTVTFYDEITQKRYSIEWQNIKEQDQLELLKINADQKTKEDQRRMIVNGIVVGLIGGISWVTVALLISIWLTRKNKEKTIVIFNVVAIVFMLFILLNIIFSIR